MIDREKLLAGLEHCALRNCLENEGVTDVCPYWANRTNCFELEHDALSALREDADEIAMLKAEAANLNLYLSELLADKGMGDLLERRHPGLPWYAEKEQE